MTIVCIKAPKLVSGVLKLFVKKKSKESSSQSST